MSRSQLLRRVLGPAFAVSVLVLSSCGTEDATTSADGTAEANAETTAQADAATGGSTSPTPEATEASGSPEWANLELTDTDGEVFTLAELAGTPVFVEHFATWCSNCRRQLEDTQAAAGTAGDAAAFVALSVETDLDAGDLAEYAADNGFDDIRFAVMTPEFLAAVTDAFGTSALNPPSTPKFLIAADGSAGELVTGFESPEEILAQVDAAA